MFSVLATDPHSRARRGRLTLPHGVVETPVFMPVGTQGSVKAMSPAELIDLDAQIILGNTYHLFIRPGTDLIRHFGSLHKFINWPRPILTDSGGFQVFSLSKLRKITEDGVHFQSHLDGSKLFLGPEQSMEIQAVLGSDIAMLFDDCPPYPVSEKDADTSLDLTLRWAARCKEWVTKNAPKTDTGARQLHFGIVQGSSYTNLREKAAKGLTALDFDGYAVGGVSVGEPEKDMMHAVESAEPHLPVDKPRYAMGLGTPPQIVEMIARGVDMFDCVIPTRLARHGTVFTATGTFNIKNQQYTADAGPLESGCACYACRGFSRAYIRHLWRANEILGIRLICLHNLHFYINLARRARTELEAGTFAEWRAAFVGGYTPHRGEDGSDEF